MLRNGSYSAWTRTLPGEGTALTDGKLTGGDTVMAYTGSYTQAGDDFTADIATKRHTLGQLSVFGIDEVDLSLVGKSIGTTASCRGTTRQAPSMTFEVKIIRIAD